jgi:hypothetical protein
MTQYLFDEPRFHDPEVAREHLEAIRWPDARSARTAGPVTESASSTARRTARGYTSADIAATSSR